MRKGKYPVLWLVGFYGINGKVFMSSDVRRNPFYTKREALAAIQALGKPHSFNYHVVRYEAKG